MREEHLLRTIELENFILFEKAAFDFSPGLNAVSGETGAGKSLVARALALALGGRGGHDVIRAGQEEARIAVEFSLPSGKDGETVRRAERVIRRDGGGKILLDGKPATAQALRTALAHFVDFAAQNEHVRLADAGYQLELLDAYGRLGEDASRYAEAFRAAETLSRRLKAGREEKELVRLKREKLAADVAELDAAKLDPDADSRLEDDIREMSSASAIVQAASEAVVLLETGDPSALDSLADARRAIGRLAGVSSRLTEAAELLDDALDSAQSALGIIAEVGEGAGADPERLDDLIGRSEKLKALARRFGCGVDGLAALREELRSEVEELTEWDAGEDEIRERLAAALPRAAETGLALGRKRRAAAKRLAKAVNRELAGLGMEQAGFSVEFEPLWSEGMPLEDILAAGPSGLDEAAFFLSPNPGEAAAPVAQAASGGEAARAVLAIKAALSDVHRPEVMFLDEIDAGVGSRLGRELGVKLRELAASRQVVVITHLPQIAAHAHAHLKVAKKVKGGRTTAWVERLDGDARLEEVAKMIHGSAAGQETREQARKMLEEGENA